MNLLHKKYRLEKYHLKDDGKFPNSKLPVLLYKGVLNLPSFFPSFFLKQLFRKNNWGNAWKSGIYTYHHYHSVTHEVIGVYKGKTSLMLGGKYGVMITIEKGDVLLIPAGVAHKNLYTEEQIECVGAYPDGKNYDINYGRKEEREKAEENIKKLPLPSKDPVFGLKGEMQNFWK